MLTTTQERFYTLVLVSVGYFIGLVLVTDTIPHAFVPSRKSCRRQSQYSHTLPREDATSEEGSLPTERDDTLMVGVMTTHRNLATRASAVYSTWGRDDSVSVVFYVGENQTATAAAHSFRGSEHDHRDVSSWRHPSSNVSPKKEQKETTAGEPAHANEPVRLVRGLPVVELRGVSDEADPPTDKAFAMLAHMHRRFGRHFRWFARAGDDVYIRPDGLAALLRSLDSEELWYLGKPVGPTKRQRLGLVPYAPHCVGGPGVVLSARALAVLAPGLAACAARSTAVSAAARQEDKELGRCVLQRLNVSCTADEKIQKEFYQESGKTSLSQYTSKKLFSTLTVNPVKDPRMMYSLHIVILKHRLLELENHQRWLLSEEQEAKRLSNNIPSLPDYGTDKNDTLRKGGSVGGFKHYRRQPMEESVVSRWERVLKREETWWGGLHGPDHGGGKDTSSGDTLDSSLDERDGLRESTPVSTCADLDHTLYRVEGVTRNHPLQSAQMKKATADLIEFRAVYDPSLKLRTEQRRIRALYQTWSPARGLQHAVVVSRRQGNQIFLLSSAFTDLQWWQTENNTRPGTEADDGREEATPPGVRVLNEDLTRATSGPLTPWPELHVLLALCGRHETYLRFLDHLMTAASGYLARVHLRVTLCGGDHPPPDNVTSDASHGHSQVNVSVVNLEDPVFSRGVALNAAAHGLPGDVLMIIIDVDLVVTRHFLFRVALNVSPGTAYFPIMFSQFSPHVVCYGRTAHCTIPVSDFSRDSGYWRRSSYGMAALTSGDFRKAGGFNTDIVGWGKEDVDFVERCSSRGIRIFSAPDVGLVHVFHKKVCDKDLEKEQLRMCQNSQLNTYGSAGKLGQMALDRGNL